MGRHKNVTQEAIIVHFMQENEDLATGNFLSKEQRSALWIKLANKLNAHGPPKKPPGRWRKVWFDWRSSIRRKILYDKIGADIAEQDYVPYKKTLSPAEHDVARVCGFYDRVVATDKYSDLQEDLSTISEGVDNRINEKLMFDDEDGENPLECHIANMSVDEKSNRKAAEDEHINEPSFFQCESSASIVKVETEDYEFNANMSVDEKSNGKVAEDEHINEPSFVQCESTASIVKVETEDYEGNIAPIAHKKRRLSPTNAENEETPELVQLVKQQTKVINSVSQFINENINLHQENLHVLNDIRQGLKEMCESLNKLSGATNEKLKEQRRHNYEMEKLRREEILLQKQQLQLNELKVFGKE